MDPDSADALSASVSGVRAGQARLTSRCCTAKAAPSASGRRLRSQQAKLSSIRLGSRTSPRAGASRRMAARSPRSARDRRAATGNHDADVSPASMSRAGMERAWSISAGCQAMPYFGVYCRRRDQDAVLGIVERRRPASSARAGALDIIRPAARFRQTNVSRIGLCRISRPNGDQRRLGRAARSASVTP